MYRYTVYIYVHVMYLYTYTYTYTYTHMYMCTVYMCPLDAADHLRGRLRRGLHGRPQPAEHGASY